MRYKPRVKTICPNCGEEFLIEQWKLKTPTKYGRFCSASCRSQYIAERSPYCQQSRITVFCTYCGKEMQMQPYRILEHNFCSNSCRGRYGLDIRWPNGAETATVTCAYCGRQKTIKKWEIENRRKRGQDKFFCDRACFGKWKSREWGGSNNPSWRGGHKNYYGPNWKRQKRQARARDNYTCQKCGISEKELNRLLEVHHIIRFADFGEDWKSANALDNLTCYCRKCHMDIEYSQDME